MGVFLSLLVAYMQMHNLLLMYTVFSYCIFVGVWRYPAVEGCSHHATGIRSDHEDCSVSTGEEQSARCYIRPFAAVEPKSAVPSPKTRGFPWCPSQDQQMSESR